MVINSKEWVKHWFLIILFIPIIGGFNYLIDPLSTNKNQLLSLTKVVQTVREEKIINVKKVDNIDNLILGSSRAMRIDPNNISRFLNGNTFNFSVNSAYPEEYLGILLFLERIGKIPKNIIIGFDFYILNDNIPYNDVFVSNSELNFIGATSTKNNNLNNYLSIDALKLSIETIYHNINQAEKITKYNASNGFLYWSEKDDLIKDDKYNHLLNIKFDSRNYFISKYSRERYANFSNERIGFLKGIKSFAKKYNITLYTYLTPVHCYHLIKIKNHKLLSNTLTKFKSLLASQFNYVDFMIKNNVNCKDENYYDATHSSAFVNKLIVDDLFSRFTIYGKRSP
jgi:hypothetical protein